MLERILLLDKFIGILDWMYNNGCRRHSVFGLSLDLVIVPHLSVYDGRHLGVWNICFTQCK